ncbi:putative ORFan [Tupanvirus deep ocean]|uniref:ORFan n=2 Tax=Tupanvirus TaxID=2094720 RepID=A0AC62A7L8_9VIRU|nr:putative ORFan [Tupanvirus deep ocean]QKU33775.1 putative ORFan [Tupanvirus deep ocean]
MSYKNQILKQLTNGKLGKKTYLDLVRKKNGSLPKNELFVNKSYPVIDEESDKMDKLISEIKKPIIRDVEFNDIDDVNYDSDNVLDNAINDNIIENNEVLPKPEIIVNQETKPISSPPKKICTSPKRKKPITKRKTKQIQPRKAPIKKLLPKSVVIPKETIATNNSKIDDIFTEQTEIAPATVIVSDKKSSINGLTEKKIKNIEEKILELEDCVVEMGIEIENLKKNQNNIINVINKLTIDINIAKNKITR